MMDLLATVPYYTAYLSRALLEEGVDVQVGSITYYLDPRCFSSRGVSLDPGCLDVVGRFRSLPKLIRRALKLLEMGLNVAALAVRFTWKPPQIVHVQYLPLLRTRLPVDYWFVLLLRARGARVVITVHDLLPHDSGDRFRPAFARLYKKADQLICHSATVAARLLSEFGLAAERIHVVPHGPFFFDLRTTPDPSMMQLRYGVAPDRPMVLWQGILLPYKGLDVLLDAWKLVEAGGAEATLLVVGTGATDLLALARAQAAALDLQHVVMDMRFVDIESLVGLYRAATVVVYPYRQITTSGALATGIALGKAVIASDLPVFRELLTDGVDALLVPPGDVDALAAAIRSLLADTGLRTRMANAMQQRNFGEASWKRIAGDTAAVYHEALRPQR